jgi:hypothetical protein
MTPIKVFFLSPTNQHEHSLRRLMMNSTCGGVAQRVDSYRPYRSSEPNGR